MNDGLNVSQAVRAPFNDASTITISNTTVEVFNYAFINALVATCGISRVLDAS
jgi:hypothetical protein